jgi:molybdopterin/thiamine biosynthesis adenylyltransferase
MNDDQLLRYSRQIMLPQVDIEGQEKLLAAKILITLHPNQTHGM